MPLFTYTGTDERYYPTLGVEAAPGVVLDLEEAPADGRWESAASPQSASEPLPKENPQPDPVPAADPAPTNL